MKRFILPLLVLCAALAPACQSPAANDNNANRGANQNAANINQSLGNTNALPTPTPNPKDKAVAVTVSQGPSGKQISVAPNTIYLSKGEAPTLHFIVYNNLGASLTDVKIEFKGAAGSPMNGPYNPVLGVGAGTQMRTNAQPLKPGVANGKYKYTVTVTVGADPAPIVLDPEIEVGT